MFALVGPPYSAPGNDATLRPMQRRTLLKVGAASALLLAAAGGTLALLTPGRRAGVLTPAGRALFASLTDTVLGDMLPPEPAARAHAIDAQLSRVQDTIAGLPPAMQAEVDELITIVASAPGRVALVGLLTAWPQATRTQVTDALQGMRHSSLALRQQAYHALRDMTNAAYFADPAAWPGIGYPGPRPVTAAVSA